jgi:hypothetical protein
LLHTRTAQTVPGLLRFEEGLPADGASLGEKVFPNHGGSPGGFKEGPAKKMVHTQIYGTERRIACIKREESVKSWE